jgi:hypothetical protein
MLIPKFINMQINIQAVDHLREKLKKDYPFLQPSTKKNHSKNFSLKPRKSFDSPVRSNFSTDEIYSIVKNSSKFVRMKDVQFPSSPLNNNPVQVKTQEWEVVTNLDCFLKHVSPKSYQKYISENVPLFQKTIVKTVKFPNIEKKNIKSLRGPSLNDANLESLGQKELTGDPLKLEKKNLGVITKKINRDVRRWCIGLAKRTDAEAQLIDHHTYKIRSVG